MMILRWFAYVFVCRLGWSCRRNFTATLGCWNCGRTGHETAKGRRYYGAQHCRDAIDEMRGWRRELPRAKVLP